MSGVIIGMAAISLGLLLFVIGYYIDTRAQAKRHKEFLAYLEELSERTEIIKSQVYNVKSTLDNIEWPTADPDPLTVLDAEVRGKPRHFNRTPQEAIQAMYDEGRVQRPNPQEVRFNTRVDHYGRTSDGKLTLHTGSAAVCRSPLCAGHRESEEALKDRERGV